MPTIRDLGLLANAVYDGVSTAPGWLRINSQAATGSLDGFQAATFTRAGETVLAFRGTAQAMDAVADLKLGTGMNSTYFAAADTYAFAYRNTPNVYVCGHSLGGAIAQVAANRGGFKFATFNAPGVAVLASRNIADASLPMTAIRTAGMVLSAFRHPFQAISDVRATFNQVRGLNVCLQNDIVSKIGVHYGDIARIPGTSANPLTEHRMTTMNAVLALNAIRLLDIAAF
jgi:hypothetical protein